MITLKTLKDASAQEVFDQAKNHLLTQNQKCQDADWDCVYKFGDLKCVAGCFISDEEYDKNMEGGSWLTLLDKKLVPDTHFDLIDKLQDIHDNYEVEYWPQKLQKLANSLNLKY